MKKIIRIIFIIALFALIIMGTNVHAATPTLQQVADAFNNCSTVKEWKDIGSVWNATVSGNKLTITASAEGKQETFDYTLDGNILSATFSNAFTGAIGSSILVDSIGTLHGYSDGEMFSTLNADEIMNYTLSNEGLEIKEGNSGEFMIKVDISKKIPLLDFSNTYITVSDLEYFKEYISGDGSSEVSRGNVYSYKSGYDGENTILVAEKDKLTENTYKSILSIVEVMFDSSKAAEYFKSNYTGISVGNKEFTGFKIEINPTKTDWENTLIPEEKGYKFVRITINKTEASKAISNFKDKADTSSNENKEVTTNEVSSSNTEKKVANIAVMPKTGEEQNQIVNVLYVLIVIASLGVFSLFITRKKE